MNNISPEGVGAIFRLHGYSTHPVSDPIVYDAIRNLVESGRLNAQNISSGDTSIATIRFLKDYLSQEYNDILTDAELFHLLDTLDFIGRMISPNGMNIPGNQVFVFLQQSLKEGEQLQKPQ